jgi:hypothetical protein
MADSNRGLTEPLYSDDSEFHKVRSEFGSQQTTDLIEKEGAASGFGAKKIGMLGSWCLLFNNITGPGMISLISIYLTCGWGPATLLFVIVGLMSGIVSDYLIDAMQMVPGNENFEKRVELMYLAKRYLGKGLYYTAFVFFVLNLQLGNIGAMIVSTQQMDWTIMAFGVPSYALEIYPNFTFTHTATLNMTSGSNQSINTDDSAFGDAYVISLGFLIVLILTVPLGYANLDDNIWVQIVSGLILGGVVLVAWIYEFGREGLLPEQLDFVAQNVGAQVGNIFFNYAYVVTIPSWVNEKKDNVSAKVAIWSSLIPSIACFTLIGALGAMSKDVGKQTLDSHDQGLDLTVALSSPSVSTFARISTFIFPWVALINGIPVLSIIIRYNLLENKICNKMWANLFAVVLPWIITIIFYAGDWVQDFLNYGSVITTIPLNLMLPCYLYILVALKEGHSKSTKRNRILCWIFIVVCTLGNLFALVIQIINSVNDGNTTSTSISETITSALAKPLF